MKDQIENWPRGMQGSVRRAWNDTALWNVLQRTTSTSRGKRFLAAAIGVAVVTRVAPASRVPAPPTPPLPLDSWAAPSVTSHTYALRPRISRGATPEASGAARPDLHPEYWPKQPPQTQPLRRSLEGARPRTVQSQVCTLPRECGAGGTPTGIANLDHSCPLTTQCLTAHLRATTACRAGRTFSSVPRTAEEPAVSPAAGECMASGERTAVTQGARTSTKAGPSGERACTGDNRTDSDSTRCTSKKSSNPAGSWQCRASNACMSRCQTGYIERNNTGGKLRTRPVSDDVCTYLVTVQQHARMELSTRGGRVSRVFTRRRVRVSSGRGAGRGRRTWAVLRLPRHLHRSKKVQGIRYRV